MTTTHHGEYKIPGGKLITANVERDGDALTRVQISGDFFLDPDEALDVIDQALVGSPVEASAGVLARRIDRALDDAVADGRLSAPVTMVGFNSHDVGVVVRRALGFSTTWDDHQFTYLDPGVLAVPQLVALDQVLAEELIAGRRGPTFRFWEWNEPAVVFGSFQSLSNEIDLEAAQLYGFRPVRRPSGGGAMFMEAGNCITFSIVVPESLVDSMSYEASYAFLDAWVLDALASVGVEASYAGLNDIASPAGKIAGAAQKRFAGGAVVHHVTMAYDIDADKMTQVLRIGREKLSDKGTKSANKRVDPVRSQTHLPREQVMAAFLHTFRSLYRTVDDDLTDAEVARMDELVASKYGTPEWTARIP